MSEFKQGDLVVIVGGMRREWIGRVGILKARCTVYQQSWDLEPAIIGSNGLEASVHESSIRHLRDDDGQDEMLRIAGLPNKETTPAAH